MVLVVQQFLDVDKDRAVGVVNDLMTARMQQFQHVTEVELPALFDDYGLDDDTRQALRDFAEELEDWMSGIQEWHRAVDRYKEPELRRLPSPGWVAGTPTGLGSAAATLASLLRTGLAAVGAGGPGNAANRGAPLTARAPEPGEPVPGQVPALVGAEPAAAVADARVPGGPTGLGTAASHVAPAVVATDPPTPLPQEPSLQSPATTSRILEGATGLGTTAARLSSLRPDRSA
jgi:germacradienol/geosmin synthase